MTTSYRACSRTYGMAITVIRGARCRAKYVTEPTPSHLFYYGCQETSRRKNERQRTPELQTCVVE